jgi:hypothetical protein
MCRFLSFFGPPPAKTNFSMKKFLAGNDDPE